jgi:hypothetical protein
VLIIESKPGKLVDPFEEMLACIWQNGSIRLRHARRWKLKEETEGLWFDAFV